MEGRFVLSGRVLVLGMVLIFFISVFAVPPEVQEYIRRGGEITIEALHRVFNKDYQTVGSWIRELKDSVSLLQYNIGYLLAEGFTVAVAVKLGVYAAVAGLAVYDVVKIKEFVEAINQLKDIKAGIVEARRRFSEDTKGIKGYGSGLACWAVMTVRKSTIPDYDYYVTVHSVGFKASNVDIVHYNLDGWIYLSFVNEGYGWGIDYVLDEENRDLAIYNGFGLINAILDTFGRGGWKEGLITCTTNNYDMLEDKYGEKDPIETGGSVVFGLDLTNEEAVKMLDSDGKLRVYRFPEGNIRYPDNDTGYRGEVVEVTSLGKVEGMGSVSVDMSGVEAELKSINSKIDTIVNKMDNPSWMDKFLEKLKKIFYDDEKVEEVRKKIEELIKFEESMDLKMEFEDSSSSDWSISVKGITVNLDIMRWIRMFRLREILTAFIVCYGSVSGLKFLLERMVI